MQNKIKIYGNENNKLKDNIQNIQNELYKIKQEMNKYIDSNNNFLKQINYLENKNKEIEIELNQRIIDM